MPNETSTNGPALIELWNIHFYVELLVKGFKEWQQILDYQGWLDSKKKLSIIRKNPSPQLSGSQ